jgi:hypothetical protein
MSAMPSVEVGDLVYWYDDPVNPSQPTLGWIIERPGRETVSVLTFSQVAGFIEKKSVRHKDDPFWRESEVAGAWSQWGCFALHPTTEILRELKPFLTKLKLDAARSADEPARRGPGRPRKEDAVEVEVAE